MNAPGHNSVAAGQFASLTERIERLHDEWPNPFGVPRQWRVAARNTFRAIGPIDRRHERREVSFEHTAAWLPMCSRLAYASGYSEFDWEERRAMTLACRLLGLRWSEIEKALSDARWAPEGEIGVAWSAYCGVPDERLLGEVYVASTKDGEAVKIGFSRDAESRVRQLSRKLAIPLVLAHREPATMLHEWALHRLVKRDPDLDPEWYPEGNIPSWLFPNRRPLPPASGGSGVGSTPAGRVADESPATLSPATATGGAAPDRTSQTSKSDTGNAGAGAEHLSLTGSASVPDDGRVAPDLDIPARLRRTA